MKKKEDCVIVVYWTNYTYRVGRHSCKGTTYYYDKGKRALFASDPYHAKRKDGAVRMNDMWVWAEQI